MVSVIFSPATVKRSRKALKIWIIRIGVVLSLRPKGEMTAEKKKQDAWRNNADKAGHCEPSRISPC